MRSVNLPELHEQLHQEYTRLEGLGDYNADVSTIRLLCWIVMLLMQKQAESEANAGRLLALLEMQQVQLSQWTTSPN